MTDIVERLRSPYGSYSELEAEAADEIERLREILSLEKAVGEHRLIVERLRKDGMHWYTESLAKESADEIERLLRALELAERQLRKVDDELKWEGTGESRIERIWRALAAEAALEALQAERDEARLLVTEANNSLYGSQGYFHSLNGGPFDKYHLARGIENLKDSARKRDRAEARVLILEEGLREFRDSRSRTR
jgi:hypothetical protein